MLPLFIVLGVIGLGLLAGDRKEQAADDATDPPAPDVKNDDAPVDDKPVKE